MTAESAESLEANLDDDIGLVEATVLKLLDEGVDIGDRVSCRTFRSDTISALTFCRTVEPLSFA